MTDTAQIKNYLNNIDDAIDYIYDAIEVIEKKIIIIGECASDIQGCLEDD